LKGNANKILFLKAINWKKKLKINRCFKINEKMFKDENEKLNQIYSGLQYTFFNGKGRNANKKL
jgi:hypothetical protein